MAPDCRNARSTEKQSRLAAFFHSRGQDPVWEQQRHPSAGRQNEGIEDSAKVRKILLDMGGLLPRDDWGNVMAVIARARRCLWHTHFYLRRA